MASFPPKTVRTGICQQVVLEGDNADLTRLPIIQCWPLDGDLDSGQVFDAAAAAQRAATQTGTGRYITLGGIHTKQPRDRRPQHRHVPRAALRPATRAPCTGTCTTTARATSACSRSAARRCRWRSSSAASRVLPYAATAPLPPGIEELLFAGFLNGGGIELVKCKTIDLEVPANAEIVIEGYVDPNEKLLEGPFGDHTGFYSLADWYPAFHVTAITHRKNPIYPTTIVGKPPMEDYFLGKATERIFLPLLKMLIPDIVDYSPADQRRVPQLRVREDPQGIPLPGPPRDARHLGRGADGVHQVHRRRGRARERARRAGRAVPPLQQLRPRTRHARSSTARSISSTTPAPTWAPAARSASTRRSNCRPKARCGRGRRNWRWTQRRRNWSTAGGRNTASNPPTAENPPPTLHPIPSEPKQLFPAPHIRPPGAMPHRCATWHIATRTAAYRRISLRPFLHEVR